MSFPSGETITPLGPDIPSAPATGDHPFPGCHSSSAPTTWPLLSLLTRSASVGSQRLVTTIPPSGSDATASGQKPFGATTHPFHVNTGLDFDRSTVNPSTDSRPPWWPAYSVRCVPPLRVRSSPCGPKVFISTGPGQS